MKDEKEIYRAVKDSFWTDFMILDLLPDEKLFYLWMFTNQHLDICGCYKVNMRMMEYETGLSRDSITIILQRFVDLGRIKFNSEFMEIILLKWKNNNEGFFKPTNHNTLKAISGGLEKIQTVEFKNIIRAWLGEDIHPIPPPTEAPTPPPNIGANDNLNHNLNRNNNLNPLTTEGDIACEKMGVSEITKLHVDYLGKIPTNQPTMSVLLDYCREYPPDNLRAAFKAVAVADKPNLNWIKTYLDNPKNWNKQEGGTNGSGYRGGTGKAGNKTGIIEANGAGTDFLS